MVKQAGARVLLVDDDALMRTLVSAGLSKTGMMPEALADGATALQSLAKNAFDLVLLDVHMPGMDGFEVLREIRRQDFTRSTPVIMLTGDDDQQAIALAFELGATDFITKPINLKLLEHRIRYAMAGHAREKRLEQLQTEQNSACEIARLGFWRTRSEGSELSWSSSAAELLGWSPQPPQSLAELADSAHPDDRPRLINAFGSATKLGHAFDLEVRLQTHSGDRVVRFNSPGRSKQSGLIGSFQDVTALRDLEQHALYLAEHDELTGLPNQQLFSRLLEQELSQADGDHQILMFAISIEPLLKLTDYFGTAGNHDGLLSMASRLRVLKEANAVASRLDDGTFGLRLSTCAADASALAQKVANLVAEPVQIGSRELPTSPAIGIAVYPTDATQASDLIRAAKLACRTLHGRPQGGLSYYNELQDEALGSRLILESDLRTACTDEQFFLVFQPQQDIQSGQIVGVEALLRWQHPERGLVSPVDFIPVLEETGLIEQVGAWVLQESVRVAAQLHMDGYDLRMGVNLSAIQLLDPTLPETLAELCAHFQLPSRAMELEVTEGMAMIDPAKSRENLKHLKSLGFGISIDDFGTGHSSLAYITDFPIDTIKIDRSFVKDVTEGRKQRAIVTTVTALARHLNLNTIAEGVETERQRDYVDALGVRELQGFLLSRPIPLQALHEFLALQPQPRSIKP